MMACGNCKSVNEFSKNQARNRFGHQKCKSCVENRDPLNMSALNDEIGKLVPPRLPKSPRPSQRWGSRTRKPRRRRASWPNPKPLTKRTSAFTTMRPKMRWSTPATSSATNSAAAPASPPISSLRRCPSSSPSLSAPLARSSTRTRPAFSLSPNKERGYTHFKCGLCNSTWGLSRGGRSLGHFCRTPTCANHINDVPIYPFVIKPFKKNHKIRAKQKQANRAAAF